MTETFSSGNGTPRDATETTRAANDILLYIRKELKWHLILHPGMIRPANRLS